MAAPPKAREVPVPNLEAALQWDSELGHSQVDSASLA